MKSPVPVAVATLALASTLSAQSPVPALTGESGGSFYLTISQEVEADSLTDTRCLLDRAVARFDSTTVAPPAVTLFFHGSMPGGLGAESAETPLWETRPAIFQVERLGADDLHVSQLVFSDVSPLVPNPQSGQVHVECLPGENRDEKPVAVVPIETQPSGGMHSLPLASDVPEPSAALLMAGAAAGLIRRRRPA